MTDLREAAQQALEVLERAGEELRWQAIGQVQRDLRAALAESVEYAVEPNGKRSPLLTHMMNKRTKEDTTLAEPEQEPVALDWLHKWANQDDGEPETQGHEGYEAARRVVQIHLTAPPQRKPLTEEEIDELSRTMVKGDRSVNWLCRAIERAHGIGDNT